MRFSNVVAVVNCIVASTTASADPAGYLHRLNNPHLASAVAAPAGAAVATAGAADGIHGAYAYNYTTPNPAYYYTTTFPVYNYTRNYTTRFPIAAAMSGLDRLNNPQWA